MNRIICFTIFRIFRQLLRNTKARSRKYSLPRAQLPILSKDRFFTDSVQEFVPESDGHIDSIPLGEIGTAIIDGGIDSQRDFLIHHLRNVRNEPESETGVIIVRILRIAGLIERAGEISTGIIDDIVPPAGCYC